MWFWLTVFFALLFVLLRHSAVCLSVCLIVSLILLYWPCCLKQMNEWMNEWISLLSNLETLHNLVCFQYHKTASLTYTSGYFTCLTRPPLVRFLLVRPESRTRSIIHRVSLSIIANVGYTILPISRRSSQNAFIHFHRSACHSLHSPVRLITGRLATGAHLALPGNGCLRHRPTCSVLATSGVSTIEKIKHNYFYVY